LLKIAEVKDRVGLGKSKIYALVAEGRFPRPYKLSPKAARWSEREVASWIEARLRAR
jgi:prophage regulatory protein